MNVTLLLADSAQAVLGKLYILGGGWSVTGPDAAVMALAVKIEVPWDRGNDRHHWSLELLDADGQPVELPGPPNGEHQPVRLEGDFEPGRPPGLKPGTPLDVAMAFNFGPMPLPADGRYRWQFNVGADTWSVGFSTRPGIPA